MPNGKGAASKSKTKVEKKAFEQDVGKLLTEKYPELAGKVAITPVRAASGAGTGKVCRAWGIDPTNGRRICIYHLAASP